MVTANTMTAHTMAATLAEVEITRACSRLAFASSAQACSSERMEGSREVADGVTPESHSTGNVMRASANSSVPTPGIV